MFSCLFLSLKRVRLGVRLPYAKAWKTAASLMNNLGTKVRGVTPLLRFPTKPQLSILGLFYSDAKPKILLPYRDQYITRS